MKWAIYSENNATAASALVAAFNPRTARAYCEGRKANADGTLIGAVPFTAAREKENRLAWIAGHQTYSSNPNDKEYCAV